MAIRIDDFDDFEGLEEISDYTEETSEYNSNQEEKTEEVEEESNNDLDFITELLKSKGIEDKSKIKFENEEGAIEELDWDNLSNKDKFGIINTEDSDTELDDSEIELINAIRLSQMSPSEYLQYVENQGVNRYLSNSQVQQYQVDQYSDDELFIMDFISRMGDVTDEQAKEALELAKSNLTLYNKLIGAIRNEYKLAEEENAYNYQLELEQAAQELYYQFSQLIANNINSFTNFAGCELNMEDEDKQQLFDFLTGTDLAGNNHFAKVLADPALAVRMGWFALHGERLVLDIEEYYQNEIANVRKDSYNKGLKDAKNKTDVVFLPKLPRGKSIDYSDIDEI